MGHQTEASGYYSMAMGYNTIAAGYGSLAIGRYNVGGGNWYVGDSTHTGGEPSGFVTSQSFSYADNLDLDLNAFRSFPI